MDAFEVRSIVDQISKNIGAEMRGVENTSEARQGLSFWFENYNRNDGPVFSIRPSGLKRHIVSLKFGAYASPCIKHIQSRATPDDYALAYAFMDQLDSSFKLKVNGSRHDHSWQIIQSFSIEVTRVVSDQHASVEILETINLIMIPLIASISELIGYVDNEVKTEGDLSEVEGGIVLSLSERRERNPRNRLLCLSIHGERCGVCGFIPQDVYGSELTSILEVHHIEPLSDIKQPRIYDPKKDLIPLCPNCHRAIHKQKPALTPDQLKEIMKS
ncbi:MAG: HNH endonuclease [Endozoicomonas sp.]|uniref:HNH endonuclease n=1 Tax=Endozoicomonas sp. TaxID=1892382 RepID=UPI003D9B3061